MTGLLDGRFEIGGEQFGTALDEWDAMAEQDDAHRSARHRAARRAGTARQKRC